MGVRGTGFMRGVLAVPALAPSSRRRGRSVGLRLRAVIVVVVLDQVEEGGDLTMVDAEVNVAWEFTTTSSAEEEEGGTCFMEAVN